MKNAVAWLVTVTYEYGHCQNKPESFDLVPVTREDQPGSGIFFRNGKVIGMPLGHMPTEPFEKDHDIIFELEPDGEIDGNEEFTWAAFSTKEAAETWIARKTT